MKNIIFFLIAIIVLSAQPNLPQTNNFKLFYTGKYDRLSTIAYVLMGWVVIFAIKPLIENLPVKGLLWLLAGGLFYTVGAILYSMKSVRYNHAVFHIFVLLGSFSHFMSIFFYVLPERIWSLPSLWCKKRVSCMDRSRRMIFAFPFRSIW